MRMRRFAVPLASVLAAACGPSEQRSAVAPTGTSAPSSSAAMSAAPTASAISSVEKKPAGPTKPVLRFWGYDGPAEGPAITGKRAWTAVPTGEARDPYRHVFISVEDFVKSDGPHNLWSTPVNELVVPIAMGMNLTPPAALKKGDPVMADNANDSALARVEGVEGDTVKSKYVFGELVGELDTPRSEVVLLDGALRLGAPVAYKVDTKWFAGRLLAKSAAEVWIALEYTDNEPYVKVKAADVRAIDVTKILKVGEACVADYFVVTHNELVPAKVTKVIDEGVFYEVKTDKGATWTVPFHHVSSPL